MQTKSFDVCYSSEMLSRATKVCVRLYCSCCILFIAMVSFQLTIFSQNEMIQTRFRSDEHASSGGTSDITSNPEERECQHSKQQLFGADVACEGRSACR